MLTCWIQGWRLVTAECMYSLKPGCRAHCTGTLKCRRLSKSSAHPITHLMKLRKIRCFKILSLDKNTQLAIFALGVIHMPSMWSSFSSLASIPPSTITEPESLRKNVHYHFSKEPHLLDRVLGCTAADERKPPETHKPALQHRLRNRNDLGFNAIRVKMREQFNIKHIHSRYRSTYLDQRGERPP